MFESSVNSEGIETNTSNKKTLPKFESSVNSEGIETLGDRTSTANLFESSVNSEGIETQIADTRFALCLRAV